MILFRNSWQQDSTPSDNKIQVYLSNEFHESSQLGICLSLNFVPLPSFEKYFLFLNINSVQFHPIDVIYLLWNYSHLLNADIYIYSTMVMVFLHYASLLAWKLLTLLFFSFVFWHLKSWLHCRLFSIVNLRMFSIWHQTNNKQHLISQVILQSFSNSS